MKTQIIGYVRVSSIDQNEQRQLEGIELDRVFIDKASGKDTNRPQLQEALKYVREGDTFAVHSMDRLARNVEDMLRLVRELNAKGVTVHFVKENIQFTADKNDPRAALMFAMLGAFSQFEREMIRERQREGIALAKAKGVYKGRKPALTPSQIEELNERLKTCTNKAQLARNFGIHRDTLYKYVRKGGSDNMQSV
jgi:DNA invertase Pin-like site-specific DNA recombinase